MPVQATLPNFCEMSFSFCFSMALIRRPRGAV
jgi:hypothetical protein